MNMGLGLTHYRIRPNFNLGANNMLEEKTHKFLYVFIVILKFCLIYYLNFWYKYKEKVFQKPLCNSIKQTNLKVT